MDHNNRPSLRKPEIFFLSFFGVGFLPKAPGTFGSLATLPFLYFLAQFNPPFVFFIPIIIIATIFSSYLSHYVQNTYKVHDPQWIVIDEVLGMTVAWLFRASPNVSHLCVLFLLFRFFDIYKMGPAKYFDKKMEHGAGIILDDLVSGIYAGCVYRLLLLAGLPMG